jgi:serpin B
VTSLAARLYAAVSAEPGNLAISPHSVAVALNLAAYGARGPTRDEIETVVGDAGKPIEGACTEVRAERASKGEWVELSSANRLFGQQGLAWQPDLQELLTVVDYADSDAARVVINVWTSSQTHERILEIVPDGVLDKETLLVLVNALYLKAAWMDPFRETSTTDADFHLSDGTVVQVPTMLGHVGAQVGAGEGWRSARLPYVGGTLAMTVVLPDPGRLADVEALVAERDWSAVLEAPAHERLELHLPRFTVRAGARLREVLIALGMPTAFTDDADFSGLTIDARPEVRACEPRREPLKISEVLHEAFVAVDEQGTEAAAATAVVMQRAGAIPQPPVPFVVDRPFLFAIHEVANGTPLFVGPLFVGRISDPR